MPLRVVFFGTPAFAVPTLEHLLGSAHQVAGVVTQPDRPRGRGHQITASPVKAFAMAAGVRNSVETSAGVLRFSRARCTAIRASCCTAI